MTGDFFVGPRDPIRLDSFRVITGLSLLGYMATWWLDDSVEWLTVAGFHLSPAAAGSAYLSPPPLPLWALAPFSLAYFGAMLAFTLGVRTPWSTILTLLGLVYVSHVDPGASFTPNSLFTLTLLILIVAPRGSYWTPDPRPPQATSVWPTRILQATLLILYFTAGTCKAFFGDWLSSSTVLYNQVQGPYRTEAAAWLIRQLPMHAWALMQSLALAFELLAPLLFAVRRLRPLAYALGAGMHLGIGVTMDEFGWFALQMVAFYTLFMQETTLHRWRTRLAALVRGA
jgi:hypothetical protein